MMQTCLYTHIYIDVIYLQTDLVEYYEIKTQFCSIQFDELRCLRICQRLWNRTHTNCY